MNRKERRSATRAVARAIVQLRGWPGMDGYRSPRTIEPYAKRLFDRGGLVVFAASRRGAASEEFGLGAFLEASGASVKRKGIIVPDDCPVEVRFAIEDRAAECAVVTTTGAACWEALTLTEFSDHRMGPLTGSYTGACFTIGADHGRTQGLLGEHWTPRRGRNTDGWEVWPHGWGKRHSRGRVMRRSPHRPPLRVTERRSGWRVEFGPCKGANGKHDAAGLWRGEFIDVLTLAYVLDADRSASFGEHCRRFGLPEVALPLSVTVDARGAEDVAVAVMAIHELALVLDERASHWFSSARDRREWRGRVDVARTASPGSLASDLLRRAGVSTPLRKFRLTHQELARWAETYHGGMTDADTRLLGVPFECAVLDVASCFPLVAHHVGWWRFLCARSIRRHDVTKEFTELCRRAVADPLVLMDPGIWRRYGVAIVEGVVPDGEWYLVEVEDPQRPDGRLELVRLHSRDRPMHFTGLDVLATCVRSGQVPRFERVVRLVPVGREEGIASHLDLLPGLVLDLDEDPVLAMVEHRRVLKERGDDVLAATLRTATLSLVYGNLVRSDEVRRKVKGAWEIAEVPGPYSFLPLGSAVSSGSHLLLILLEHLISAKGGAVAYRDTDSSIVPFSRHGGALLLPDDADVRVLSADDLEEIVDAFAPLSPSGSWPVWKVRHG